MSQEMTDRYERELQRRHEERLGRPPSLIAWLRARIAPARRG
jgi:hypothetical protein